VEEDDRRARLEEAAQLYERAAEELGLAQVHCLRSAEHFRSADSPAERLTPRPRWGHLKVAEDRLLQQARDHRERSSA
jgi:hypothetical protein